MKLYTKRGDEGKTDLFGGERVSKAHPRVRAYGAIDAANSALGFVWVCEGLDQDMKDAVQQVMGDLFSMGAELATAQKASAAYKLSERLTSRVDRERMKEIEHLIDCAEAELPALTSFILPGGTEAAARLHLARTSVRNAEKEIVALIDASESVRPELLCYINRLSDLLFVWARLANYRARVPDVLWSGRA